MNEKRKRLESLASQIIGDRKIDISWQEVVKTSSYSFFIEGIGHAFFHYRGIEYFAVQQDLENKITAIGINFKVDFICKIDHDLMSELQGINEDYTFEKDHYNTLQKIIFKGNLNRLEYDLSIKEKKLVDRMTDKIIYRKHYPKRICYFFGHQFGHDRRKKFIEEYKTNKSATIKCLRCKCEFKMYTIQNMSPTLHEIILTFPSYIHYKIFSGREISQKQFIQSANGMSLYIGYLILGIIIGIIYILFFNDILSSILMGVVIGCIHNLVNN